MKIVDILPDEWQELVEKISSESCILLLGPNLYKDSDKKVLQQVLYERLESRFKNKLAGFFPEDGFFVPKDDRIVNDMRLIVKKFYEGDFPDESLKKLVQMPFHCMIALTPDMLLKRTFDKYEVDCQFDRFSMTQPVNEKLEEATKENPLIYNVFGSIEEEETIILTHDHFFTYLKNIIGDERLPDPMRRAIKKATNLIFVGFTFEKWWVQLLMRLLGLHVFQGLKRLAVEGHSENSFSKITEEQFQIDFIEDDAGLFIDELFKHYVAGKKFLRELNHSQKESETAQQEIKNNRIAELAAQIKKAMAMRNEYEDKRITSSDPKETERCNMEIDKLNQEINQKTAELQSLKS